MCRLECDVWLSIARTSRAHQTDERLTGFQRDAALIPARVKRLKEVAIDISKPPSRTGDWISVRRGQTQVIQGRHGLTHHERSVSIGPPPDPSTTISNELGPDPMWTTLSSSDGSWIDMNECAEVMAVGRVLGLGELLVRHRPLAATRGGRVRFQTQTYISLNITATGQIQQA